ncbi:hemagglutinin protein [Agrobacterium phage Atu_ph07]|uniref:Hemagglutinin protein n=1 Tax=Agrobacterium phage Atu_ph07 TaxID=2024264 RepID=A0A2L0UZX4_9CAUD|nr:hemagglutinin protein [Agrobacterium phage Atu_ph07]AUZ95081.1 hemagglutinin protein [Agrobacterium phage Atu_ph07]
MHISLRGVNLSGTFNKWSPPPVDHFEVSEKNKQTVSKTNFGFTVEAEGNEVFVGAPNSGSLTGYSITGDTLTSLFSTAVFSNSGRLGYRLSASGNWLMAATSPASGNGEIYMFSKTAGSWNMTTPAQIITAPPAYTESGFSYGAAIDGTTLAVGHIKANTCGAVHIYDYNGTSWVYTTTLTVPSSSTPATTNQNIGFSVSIKGDLLVAGGPGDLTGNGNGVVMFSKRSNGVWSTPTITTISETTTSGFGFSVHTNGTRIVASAPAFTVGNVNGNIRLFDNSMNLLQILTVSNSNGTIIDPQSATSDRLGQSVSINDSGNVIAAGAQARQSNTGAVYTFEQINNVWSGTPSGIGGMLTGSGTTNNSRFGSSVAFTGDKTLIVGAFGITSVFMFK